LLFPHGRWWWVVDGSNPVVRCTTRDLLNLDFLPDRLDGLGRGAMRSTDTSSWQFSQSNAPFTLELEDIPAAM